MKPIGFNNVAGNPVAVIRFYVKPDKNGHRHMDHMDKQRMKEILFQCANLIEVETRPWKRAQAAMKELQS